MTSILITGANRGLGLGLVKQFLRLENPPKFIFATVRDQSKAQELRQLADQNTNLRILELDVTNFESHPAIVTELENALQDKGLDLLINNAGFAARSTRISFAKSEDFDKSFLINCTAPIMLSKALVPLLKKAASATDNAWIVNMSSLMGSITDNNSGGMYSYRASKAALNMCTKSLSIDLKDDNIAAMVMHPGWVQTDMGGSNAPLSIEASCAGMVDVIRNLKKEDTGKFYQHDGKQLAW